MPYRNYSFCGHQDDFLHRAGEENGVCGGENTKAQDERFRIIAKDEHRCLELKKTTGELQDGMHPAVEVKSEYIGLPGRARA